MLEMIKLSPTSDIDIVNTNILELIPRNTVRKLIGLL